VQVIPLHDLTLIVEAIHRTADQGPRSHILLQMVAEARAKAGLSARGLSAACSPALTNYKDSGTAGQRSQVAAILEEWCTICESEGGLPSSPGQVRAASLASFDHCAHFNATHSSTGNLALGAHARTVGPSC
jgi:hypothetical protein